MSLEKSHTETHDTHQPPTTHLANIALMAIREPLVVVEALARPAESHQVRDHALGVIQAAVVGLTKNIVK